ncbi:MAG: CoA transferase [Gammaproteobacteria bacterium]|nr:CoA transferase [Gammaproteobacteria bacterium]
MAGIGPGPFACMLLADMGAEVLSVHRPDAPRADPRQIVQRGRTVVHADLKDTAAREQVLTLIAHADVLVEGFRPGVMERLGLGPDAALARQPRLVYGRMTGWGQQGPLAQAAGHDLNYIAITGALHAIGPAERPVPPLNLVGDYGGGSLYLVVGILAALHEARASGKGQVVDAAIVDGSASLMAQFIDWQQRGLHSERRESNALDGGAPWYAVYETSDGLHVSLGAIEPAFFAQFCEAVGLPADLSEKQNDRAQWPSMRAALAALFRERTRAEWQALLEGTDACFAAVLPLSEARQHPHLQARGTFVDVGDVVHPAPAPRFSRTPSAIASVPGERVATLDDAVRAWAR